MIKHSKYRNTGILFELLVRQATSDLMTSRDPRAVKIFKKFFTNTELGKEYSLYNAVASATKLSEAKAESLLNTVLDQAKKLDRDKLLREKYALIREVKKHYDLEDFFKAKIDNYRVHASVYTLLESSAADTVTSIKQTVATKTALIEHISAGQPKQKKSEAVQEFLKEDKEIRVLAYKILVEKFNEKYSTLSKEQKDLLKEYINNIVDTKKLKVYLNKKLLEVKTELKAAASKTGNKVLQIKLNEVVSLIKPIGSNESIKDEVLIGLMQYFQLIQELKAIK